MATTTVGDVAGGCRGPTVWWRSQNSRSIDRPPRRSNTGSVNNPDTARMTAAAINRSRGFTVRLGQKRSRRPTTGVCPASANRSITKTSSAFPAVAR